MRNTIAALAAFLGLLVTPHAATYAADLGGRPAVAPVAEPMDILAYKGGAYVGIAGAYSAAVFEAETIDFGGQDPMVGLYGGYTFVQHGWAIGLEGDYFLTAIESVSGDSGFQFKATNDYLASIRARGGVTWGPVLFYVTGGVAFTEQKITISGESDSKQLVGFAGGGGVEAELTRTITLRLESLYYGFDDEAFNIGGDTIEASNEQTTVRAGISFKLN
jgi:outer membrane immunogenic protein